jgi:hypothetical protein
MSDVVLAALILAAAILIATAASIYFSEWHSCMREAPNYQFCVGR